jgi:UDP-N-acetyl-alpha-D-muramoyl-L-alanyl-L-glutamate epimerase
VTPTFTTLRQKHSALRYRGHSIARHGDEITATFLIDLEPGIEFRPTLTFSAPGYDDASLEPFLTHIGLVETISYWKAACPRRVVLEGLKLSEEQRAWWHDLFIHGLGEFFFVNNIDPTTPDLLAIEANGARALRSTTRPNPDRPEKELVLAAGGKDSSLALEMLSSFAPNQQREVLILNPTRSASQSVQIAGYADPLIVRRTIDPKLLDLNAQGYLNGHTPFSAYLAFLGIMIADINGCSSVIVSNERSASEENTIFHGLPVNHQYSKGLRFERRFREYVAANLPGSASYYSIIRPLYDLQVSALFSRCAPQHLSSFRSCNVGQRGDRWCGACPKCAFVCITLAPFLPREERMKIFGGDLFETPAIVRALEELTGIRDHKPLECVGTLAESRDALVLTLARYERDGITPPSGLLSIAQALRNRGELPTLAAAQATLTAWTDEHELPPLYAEKLRALLSEVA